MAVIIALQTEENLIYKFTTSVHPSVRDGTQVRHGRSTGPGPALPDEESRRRNKGRDAQLS